MQRLLCPPVLKRLVSILALSLLAVLPLNRSSAADARPNIVWLSCEDISPHLGCYGDPHAITPHLDQLATEGVRFTNVYTTAGVCAPCRSTIITGMYQTTIGTHHMRCQATLPDEIKAFPVYLREAGYYCTNNSKRDYQFRPKDEPWDKNGNVDWSGRAPGQPFFSVFNFTGCHESGIARDSKYRQVTANLTAAQRQDPQELELPPYYPDTPVTREDWKRNYELITAMDAWAGKLIQQLKDDGLYDNTIIMFWSDHGVGLPRAKRWLYDSGTHIPFIVRIPERFREPDQGRPGDVDDQLVSSVDFAPTVLNLAGLPIPDDMQGRAFLGSGLAPERDYVFGARDRMDERYDIIRSVRDKRYRYIRNYEPFKPYYQYMNTPEKGATMRELRRLHAAGTLPPAAELFMAEEKPPEELYDCEADPHEIHNLAEDPGSAEKLAEMRAAQRQWARETRDLGLIPEPLLTTYREKWGTEFAILRRPEMQGLSEQLVSAASMASEGAHRRAALIDGLSSPHPAIRYWSAIGLGNLAEAARGALPQIRERLADTHAIVRVAAARALCRMGHPDQAVDLLIRELEHPDGWLRLHAAIVLDEIEDDARPAIPALQAALENQPNKYIVRVANRALNELQGTNNVVP